MDIHGLRGMCRTDVILGGLQIFQRLEVAVKVDIVEDTAVRLLLNLIMQLTRLKRILRV